MSKDYLQKDWKINLETVYGIGNMILMSIGYSVQEIRKIPGQKMMNL